MWDIYHFLKSGESVEELSEELLSCVKYLHIADPVGRKYPSIATDKEVFTVMRTAAWRTGVKYLAVEAFSQNFEADALQARKILQQQFRNKEE